MKSVNKRAQQVFGLSFGMIFSIFLIIFVIGAGFFAVKSFMGLNECAEAGLFYDSLQQEIDRAWTSTIYSDKKEFSVPEGIPEEITKVCFGSIPLSSRDSTQQALYETNPSPDANVFLYPPENACNDLSSKELEHFNTDRFVCAEVSNGKIILNLNFDESDSADGLVAISVN